MDNKESFISANKNGYKNFLWLDLKDFIKVLQYVGNEGKSELQAS